MKTRDYDKKVIYESVEELLQFKVLTHEFLSDLLSTATYGSAWCEVHVHDKTPDDIYKAAKEKYDCREDIWAEVLIKGGMLAVYDIEDEDDEDPNEPKCYELTLEGLTKGFIFVMINYPSHYGNIIEENYDLIDADAVLQCSVFDDWIYG